MGEEKIEMKIWSGIAKWYLLPLACQSWQLKAPFIVPTVALHAAEIKSSIFFYHKKKKKWAVAWVRAWEERYKTIDTFGCERREMIFLFVGNSRLT
jgi:hypothetical protein